MKKLARIVAICSAFISPYALANNSALFDNVISFGDSLSDVGNSTAAPDTVGGSTWVYYLGQRLGFNITASQQNGSDYAFVGAVSGDLPYTPDYSGDTPPTLIQQIQDEYLNSHGGHADANALYTIDAGANDISNPGALFYFIDNLNHFDQASLNLINASTGNILTAANLLHQAGAQYIIVANLPDIAKTPLGQQLINEIIEALHLTPEEAANLLNFSYIYNARLLSELNASGLNIIQLDTLNFLTAIQDNYQLFGFIGPDSEYTGSGDPDQYIFKDDGFHPTAAVHKIFSQYAMDAITGPMYAAVLANAPFAVIDGQNKAIRSQLSPLEHCYDNVASGKFTSFAAGNYNSNRIDQFGQVQPGYRGSNQAYTVGGTYHFNANGIVGAAIGRSMGDITYAHQAGGFDLDENMLTLFGGYYFNHFYGNLELNYANIDFSNIKRNFMLGRVAETVMGNTTGQQFAAGGLLGYNFNYLNQHLKAGPVVTFDWQRVIVKPYAETSSHFNQTNNGGAFDALQYDKQENDSLLGGLGWQINWETNFNTTTLVPYLQATYNHQFNNQYGHQKVYAGVTTEPGSEYYIPVTMPDNDFGLINTGVQAIFNSGLMLTLNYNTMIGEPQQHSQNIMLSASMPL